MARSFLEIALLVLAVVIGAYLWRHFVDKPRVTTKIAWYEKPIVIPPKIETKSGTPLPPDSETVRRDTIILTAPCDSLRDLAMRVSKPFSATFEDTVGFADSSAVFWAREITTIEVDPWTRIITKAREFQDAYLRAARVETTETAIEIDWLFSLGAFVLGMIVAILLV